MASVVYHDAISRMMKGDLDFDEGQADIRCKLYMTNTTAATDVDAVNIADFGTEDEMDGAGYVVKTFSSQAVTDDDANNRAEFDAEDLTWTSLGNGTREIDGALIYEHVDGTDANDRVVAYVEFASSVNPGGGDFTITWDGEGIIQGASA